ncbi:MAG: hypothetical protein ABI035_11350 [Gemmatimonadaceae bacterium]
MIPNPLPDRAPAQRALFRFRTATGVIAVITLVLLLLQYTPHALFPQPRTYTLWGALVGIVGMGLILDRRWVAAARRGRTG